MTDGEALLRAIREQPDEDTPRLIYADWLQEQGDDEVANYIRAEVGNPQPLVHSNGSPYWYRRGFVELVECDAMTWVRIGDMLLRQPYACIREVRLTSVPVLASLSVWDTWCKYQFVGREPKTIQSPDGLNLDPPTMKQMLVTEWPGITFTLPPINRYIGIDADAGNPANWSLGRLPAAGDEVVMPGGGATVGHLFPP